MAQPPKAAADIQAWTAAAAADTQAWTAAATSAIGGAKAGLGRWAVPEGTLAESEGVEAKAGLWRPAAAGGAGGRHKQSASGALAGGPGGVCGSRWPRWQISLAGVWRWQVTLAS